MATKESMPYKCQKQIKFENINTRSFVVVRTIKISSKNNLSDPKENFLDLFSKLKFDLIKYQKAKLWQKWMLICFLKQ